MRGHWCREGRPTLKLRVVQAEFGDCLILEFGTAASPRYLLVDGGPPTTYEGHLRGELVAVNNRGGRLDLVILSHVDNDHVIGLLDLFAELRAQRSDSTAETIAVDTLWHNAFSQTIGQGTDIETRLNHLIGRSTFAGLTGDFNPLHVDAEYAKRARFGERIAHGMLTAGLISTVLGMRLPGPGGDLLEPNASISEARTHRRYDHGRRGSHGLRGS